MGPVGQVGQPLRTGRDFSFRTAPKNHDEPPAYTSQWSYRSYAAAAGMAAVIFGAVATATETTAPEPIPAAAPAATHAAPAVHGAVQFVKKGLTGRIKRVAAEDVVITLTPVTAERTTALLPPRTIEIDMVDKRFVPRYVTARPGDVLRFMNSDDFRHNVFSLSANYEFDLGAYRTGPGPPVTLDRPGVIKVYCNIHQEMACFVVVAPTDSTAVTGSNGVYGITAAPGQYVLKAWSLRGEYEQEVAIPDTDDVLLDIDIAITGGRSKQHKNKHGKLYPLSGDQEEY